ncbi:Endophilin-A3 [Cichlidogyrus casuarinus]|uniref:Endophilin-A3 n=1 Tax=Cichlidogyrus casuarinus TaxID=1844966 RepID=A0ABD2QC41_9PLAT
MSLAGLRKQINKANQFVTEKIGGVEGTKLDDDYVAIEKKIDAMTKLFDEVLARTHEYLQPNPALRAKLLTVNTFNKIQGKSKSSLYPLPEGQLGDCMIKYGQELEDSSFGECLQRCGESFKFMSDIRYAMEDQVKDNYLVPLNSIQAHELKEIGHHRKKLEGRRLDFDCKKRKQGGGTTIPQDEIRIAEEKFQESKLLAETAMVNFLNSEVEHIQALTEFITSQMEYHRQATDIMEQLQKYLVEKKEEAESKPKDEHQPKRFTSALSAHDTSSSNNTNGYPILSVSASPSGQLLFFKSKLPVQVSWHADQDQDTWTGAVRKRLDCVVEFHFRTYKSGSSEAEVSSPSTDDRNWAKSTLATEPTGMPSEPCCKALYTFDAENESELPFKEGAMIKLVEVVDENWYLGEHNGKRGYFPINYVEIVTPLP